MLEHFEEQIKTTIPYTKEQILEKEKNFPDSVGKIQVGDKRLFFLVRRRPTSLPITPQSQSVEILSVLLRELENTDVDMINRMKLKFTGMNDKLPVFTEI